MFRLQIYSFIILAILLIPSIASARCVGWSCFVVTGKVKDCEYKTFSNEDKVQKAIKSLEKEGREAPAILSEMISSISGAEISLSEAKFTEALCHEESKLLAQSSDRFVSSKFFIKSEDKTICETLKDKIIQKFIAGRCCDTIPGRVECVVPEQLTEIPAFVKTN